MELHERLKKARKHAGYASVRDAAEALNVPYPTYAGHENGSSGFRRQSATKYARRFGVSLDWLLDEKGPMTNANPDRDEYAALYDRAPEDVRQAVLTILRSYGKPSKIPKP
jgi:transcriptional regulator with XRE-family HTH domain